MKKSAVRLIIAAVATVAVVITSVLFPFDTRKALEGAVLLSAKSYLSVIARTASGEKNDEKEKTEVSESVSAVAKAAVKKKDLTVTDDDIKKLMRAAEKASADDEKGGSVTEYTFTTDGVTDKFENVRVKNTNKTKINIEKKLAEKLDLSVSKSEPSVLIYHTHTTETYQLLDRGFYSKDFATRSSNKNINMVRVGKAICDEIESRGYKVIHDTDIYDSTYSGAYYRSEDAAKALLEKYPSIKITLDIHRDAIQNGSTKTKPVAVINGKKAAQLMIITGCQEEGNGITDLPLWEKNLTFALKLQQKMETSFTGLTRPVFFCDRSYNMGLTPLSLLVEVGSDANTLDEAVYSGKMLGSAISDILEEYEEN